MQDRWLAGGYGYGYGYGYDLGNMTFLEVDSMVVSWWIVTFWPSDICNSSSYNTVHRQDYAGVFEGMLNDTTVHICKVIIKLL